MQKKSQFVFDNLLDWLTRLQRIVFLLSFGSFELPPYKVMSVKHFHEVYCEFNTFGPLLHRIKINDKRHDMSEDLAFFISSIFLLHIRMLH